MICETCFNPRTRVGCDRGFETCTCPNTVSIHAPAWGATNAFAFRAYNYIWFQSTHPRGVRLLALVSLRPMQRFNPRTRVGCDLAAAFSSPCRKLVSIHAPAWGATHYQRPGKEGQTMFQSTHPRGVRPSTSSATRTTARFQSTHPRGVRHPPPQGTRHPHAVSIHAPAWGATQPKLPSIQDTKQVSIHAPAWGATGTPPGTAFRISCFNPRTRVGCDHPAGYCQGVEDAFQSTHPRGVRHMPEGSPAAGVGVSIHAPAWGATCRYIYGRCRAARFNPRTRVGCDP